MRLCHRCEDTGGYVYRSYQFPHHLHILGESLPLLIYTLNTEVECGHPYITTMILVIMTPKHLTIPRAYSHSAYIAHILLEGVFSAQSLYMRHCLVIHHKAHEKL